MKKLVLALAAASSVVAATAADARNLIGVDIAPSSDWVYYWYSDNGGEVSAGDTDSPMRQRGPQSASMMQGGYALMAVAINNADRVYYWWQLGSVVMLTVGTSRDHDAYQTQQGFQEVSGDYILLDAAINSQDRVYYYWRHRDTNVVYNSVGTSTSPLAYNGMRVVATGIFGTTHGLREVGIASDDHVYFYWRRSSDQEWIVTSGTSTEPLAYRDAYVANIPN